MTIGYMYIFIWVLLIADMFEDMIHLLYKIYSAGWLVKFIKIEFAIHWDSGLYVF